MKKEYKQMKVSLVGALKNVVDKSGAYLDLSGQWDDKTFDNRPDNRNG